MSDVESFLSEFNRHHWPLGETPAQITPLGYYRPMSTSAIEVAYASAANKPTKESTRQLWKARHRGRAAGVLLVVAYPASTGDRAALVGLYDEGPTNDLRLSVVERRIEQALDAEAERETRELLEGLFAAQDDDIPGLRNKGLFASHSLRTNTPLRPDWASASASARAALGTRGEDLLAALGWSISHKGADLLLRPQGKERDRAIAVLLEGDEVFERPASRYGAGTSPVEHGLEVARQQEVPWVLAVRGTVIRLYAANPDIGVTRTGAASYAELTIDLLDDENLAYAWLLLTPGALSEAGTVDDILRDSREHATDLGTRLRDRIYVDVIPGLAETIASKLGDMSEKGLDDAYHHTLVVLFRLLFVAYAEDRGLLPYRINTVYTRDALKTRAKDFAQQLETGAAPNFDRHASDIWGSLQDIWSAVHNGHTDWGVPEYGGALFRDDSRSGEAIAGISLTNHEVGPALFALLVDTGNDGTRGPVDFQALSVREFGTIYEGLLESSLSLAAIDLTVEAKSKAYVPAKAADKVVVPAGSVYFHNASGARKATGSYFTKEFAVQHLLETALDPTVREHLERIEAMLDAGREGDAFTAFFDFRVADIAMGSGHFLVAAVDRIAVAMSDLLGRRSMPGVIAELDRIRAVALDKLQKVGVSGAEAPEITYEALLRRQVARLCIYGVDINEIAVDLARLALWIHTFVPGLPMSSLDHGLVHGNSLTGIGTVEEALDVLEPERVRAAAGVQSFFRDELLDGIASADESLARAGRLAEVSVAETIEAEALQRAAAENVRPVRQIFDAAVAGRLRLVDLRVLTAIGWEALVAAGGSPQVQAEIEKLRPVHFPVAFPEVFRPGRERPGFDVVLGNPPWEEVTVEEDKFWGMHDAHLRATASSQAAERIATLRTSRPDLIAELERQRATAAVYRAYLLRGPYPGMGTGDPDLYKAFCWRFTTLIRQGGRIGVVLPRSAFATKGSAPWREAIFSNTTSEIFFVVNENEWLFTDVNPGWPVALLTSHNTDGDARLAVAGPFHNRPDFEAGRRSGSTQISLNRLKEVDPLLCVPTVDNAEEIALFAQLIEHPSIGSSRRDFDVRPATELHATNDGKKRFFTNSPADFPVYNHLNVGHFIFDTQIGAFNYADWEEVVAELQHRRLRTFTRSDSPLRGTAPRLISDQTTLPARNPRILFRDVVHASNPRKVWAALAPANILLTNKAPYLVFIDANIATQAYLLGILSSAVCDWFGHLRVVLNLNFFIFNTIPVPLFDESDPRCIRLGEIAARLALTAEGNYGEWSLFGPPIDDSDQRRDLIAELDALASLLYDIPEERLALVFDRPTRSNLSTIRLWRKHWATSLPTTIAGATA